MTHDRHPICLSKLQTLLTKTWQGRRIQISCTLKVSTKQHTYIHTYTHAYKNTYIHIYIHTHQVVSTCSSCAYIKTYINAYIPVRSCLLLCVHEYIHTYIHTYIYTFRLFRSFSLCVCCVCGVHTHTDILPVSSKNQSIVSFASEASLALLIFSQVCVFFCLVLFCFVAFLFPFFPSGIIEVRWSRQEIITHVKSSGLYKEANR